MQGMLPIRTSPSQPLVNVKVNERGEVFCAQTRVEQGPALTLKPGAPPSDAIHPATFVTGLCFALFLGFFLGAMIMEFFFAKAARQ